MLKLNHVALRTYIMKIDYYKSEIIIVGGGLAGIVTAYQLLEENKPVLLIEKGKHADFGGLAKDSFGGIHLINTPLQRFLRIHDSIDLAYRDWERVANFAKTDEWPRRWAKFYCENSLEIFYFLKDKKINFLPLVSWPERGLFHTKSSIPRWHIVQGTGYEIITRLQQALDNHKNRHLLTLLFEHDVSSLQMQDNRVIGVLGKNLINDQEFNAQGEHIVIASGGICGGDLSKLRNNWYKAWGEPPKVILNGSHIYADGHLHDEVEKIGGRITHLDKQWNYPAGIHHPGKRKPNDGLSLVPPRSAIWVNAIGERIGPVPLIGATDSRFLVESIVKQPGKYSWQILNWKIAVKELAVSDSNYMQSFRTKNKFKLLKELLFGNKDLVNRLIDESIDFVTAHSLEELVDKMNFKSLEHYQINLLSLKNAIKDYDDEIDRGERFFVDEQLRRLTNMRLYLGDKLRLCKNQKILDKRAFPLIAIREFILSRKSLGGIQTDLNTRVLGQDGKPIPGLYAVGEAAGYGGGGIHGIGAMEGTFLGSCILNGFVASKYIASGS